MRFGLFRFGANGCFLDATGNRISLWGVLEAEIFFRYLDESFESPIGRKILYAATDAEEVFLRNPSFEIPRFFGQRKIRRALLERANTMGWGRFGDGSVQSPCHDTLAVGFALAHEEHFAEIRLNIDWQQTQSELIRWNVTPHPSPMQPAPRPTEPAWGQSKALEVDGEVLGLDLEVRQEGFFYGDQRSFFMPTLVLDFLESALLGRPLNTSVDVSWMEFAEGGTEQGLFVAFASAARAMFGASTYPVYVLAHEDWIAHVRQRIQHRGLGQVNVLETRQEGDFLAVFRIQAPYPAVVCGLLVAMWERCYGSRARALVEISSGFVDLHVKSPKVNYS